MPDFTITKVRNAGEKDNPHGGTLVKWYIGLQDAPSGNEDVYCQKKPGNDLSPGMEISGRLEKGEYGWRLFPEPQQGGNFKAPQSLRDGPAREERPDPQAERSRRIERQHSQEMALRVLQIRTTAVAGEIKDLDDGMIQESVKKWTDFFVQDVDADVGSGQAAHDASEQRPPVDGDAADLSAVNALSAEEYVEQMVPPNMREEASPAQKSRLTQEFHKAGLSREAMKAIVMWRCGQEKATKQGASQLITDLQEGATHDALLAEIWDAKRAGNPLGARAAALIPTETPADTEGLAEWKDDGSLPEVPKKDESDIPF